MDVVLFAGLTEISIEKLINKIKHYHASDPTDKGSTKKLFPLYFKERLFWDIQYIFK